MNIFALKLESINRRSNIIIDDISYYRTSWMVPRENVTPTPTPTTYEIEVAANSTTKSRGQQHDEFHIVTKGSGTTEAGNLNVGTIVYSSCFSTYKLLQAGADGITLMTIRMAPENNPNFISEHECCKKIIQPIDRGDCSALKEVEVFKDLIDGAHGALTGIIRIPPDFELNTIHELFPGDKFIFVNSGSFCSASVELTQWDHVFLTADELLFSAKSGLSGAELIVLQFTQ